MWSHSCLPLKLTRDCSPQNEPISVMGLVSSIHKGNLTPEFCNDNIIIRQRVSKTSEESNQAMSRRQVSESERTQRSEAQQPALLGHSTRSGPAGPLGGERHQGTLRRLVKSLLSKSTPLMGGASLHHGLGQCSPTQSLNLSCPISHWLKIMVCVQNQNRK